MQIYLGMEFRADGEYLAQTGSCLQYDSGGLRYRGQPWNYRS